MKRQLEGLEAANSSGELRPPTLSISRSSFHHAAPAPDRRRPLSQPRSRAFQQLVRSLDRSVIRRELPSCAERKFSLPASNRLPLIVLGEAVACGTQGNMRRLGVT
jgi:hypothetical protein